MFLAFLGGSNKAISTMPATLIEQMNPQNGGHQILLLPTQQGAKKSHLKKLTGQLLLSLKWFYKYNANLEKEIKIYEKLYRNLLVPPNNRNS